MEEKIIQNLTLENRTKLMLSGVSKVDNFNEDAVVLSTNKGKLTVKGSGLSINKLNVEDGKLTVNGHINSLVYSDNADKEKGGLIKKMFK